MTKLKVGRFTINRKVFIIAVAVFLVGMIVLSLVSGKKGGYSPPSNDSDTSQTDTGKLSEELSQEQVAQTTVVFVPDTISDADKTVIKTKLVQPYVDYRLQYRENAGYSPAATITITRMSDGDYAAQQDAKFRYTVDVALKNGGNEQFLYGQDDKIDWLLPSCPDQECGLTDAYKLKYPEIVAQLKARGDQL